jgi:hypothetical protein
VKALCEDTRGRLRANIENLWGITALQIAMEMKHDEVVKTLLERPEVAKQVEGLYRDRQVHVDAANASVTFAGWLQPPLGYSAFFGSASIEVGARPIPIWHLSVVCFCCRSSNHANIFCFSTPCLSSSLLQPSWWERVLHVP